MTVLNGLLKLLSSAKGTLSLLMLFAVFYLAVSNHLNAYVSLCLAVIQTVFAVVHSMNDRAAMGIKSNE